MTVAGCTYKLFKLQVLQFTEGLYSCVLSNSYYCQTRGGDSHTLVFSHSNQWERAELSMEKLHLQVRPLGFYFPLLGLRERKSWAITQAQAVQ